MQQLSISEWYPLFSDVSIKTIILEMDTNLMKRLQEDGCDTDAETICSQEYIRQLKNAIALFNNEAFVKNNWHAPVVNTLIGIIFN